jgi:hypothetical protein
MQNRGLFKLNKIIYLIMFFILSVFSFAVCNTDQLINTACEETVLLSENCDYVDIYDSSNVLYNTIELFYDSGTYLFNYTLNITNAGVYRLDFCDDVVYAYIRIIDADVINDLDSASGQNAELQYIDNNISNERLMILGIVCFLWFGSVFIGFRFGQKIFVIFGAIIGIVLGIILFTWIYWWLGLAIILLNTGLMFFSFSKK